VKLCYECLDKRTSMERKQDRLTTYGEQCEKCRRIESNKPPKSN
jgi:hypothetical protein